MSYFPVKLFSNNQSREESWKPNLKSYYPRLRITREPFIGRFDQALVILLLQN